MRRLRVVLLIGCGLAAGCGQPPPQPTVDAAAEKEDEAEIKRAGKAERKGKPTGKTEPNPDDD